MPTHQGLRPDDRDGPENRWEPSIQLDQGTSDHRSEVGRDRAPSAVAQSVDVGAPCSIEARHSAWSSSCRSLRALRTSQGKASAVNRAPTLQPNLASGLSRERVEGLLALALRRLVRRHMGLRLVLVRLRFLFFLISFLSLRHGDPPVCSLGPF